MCEEPVYCRQFSENGSMSDPCQNGSGRSAPEGVHPATSYYESSLALVRYQMGLQSITEPCQLRLYRFEP
jgi:hypothetical protein